MDNKVSYTYQVHVVTYKLLHEMNIGKGITLPLFSSYQCVLDDSITHYNLSLSKAELSARDSSQFSSSIIVFL